MAKKVKRTGVVETSSVSSTPISPPVQADDESSSLPRLQMPNAPGQFPGYAHVASVPVLTEEADPEESPEQASRRKRIQFWVKVDADVQAIKDGTNHELRQSVLDQVHVSAAGRRANESMANLNRRSQRKREQRM